MPIVLDQLLGTERQLLSLRRSQPCTSYKRGTYAVVVLVLMIFIIARARAFEFMT